MSESIIEYAKSRLPTEYGEFEVYAFRQPGDDSVEHLAIVHGDLGKYDAPIARVHSECLTGEVLHSLRCDCREQLDRALTRIGQEDGVVLYLRQEGRGIGLGNKLRAYALQDQGHDTLDANLKLGFGEDDRDYQIAVDIFKHLGVETIRLMTNNPEKVAYLEKSGIRISERLPIVGTINPHNEAYLVTKKERFGHMGE